MRFVRGDARHTGFPGQGFRVIILMASSFGYFIDERENGKILGEAFRLLMPEGSFLLDLPDREYVLENMVPLSWHEAKEEFVVCRRRRLGGDSLLGCGGMDVFCSFPGLIG